MRLGCSHRPTTADSQSRLPPHPTGNVASEARPDPAADLRLTTTSLPTRSHGSARRRHPAHTEAGASSPDTSGSRPAWLDSASGDLDRALRALTAAADHKAAGVPQPLNCAVVADPTHRLIRPAGVAARVIRGTGPA